MVREWKEPLRQNDRAERFYSLAESDPTLFWDVVYTMLVMEDRKISKKQLYEFMEVPKSWVEKTLAAGIQDRELLTQNLLDIDAAITAITEDRGEA